MADTFSTHLLTTLSIPALVIAGPVSFLLFYAEASATVQFIGRLLGVYNINEEDSRIESSRFLISFALYFMHLMLLLSDGRTLDTTFTIALAAIVRAFLWTTCMNVICVGLYFGTWGLWRVTMAIRALSIRRAGEAKAETLRDDVELGEQKQDPSGEAGH